MSGSETNSLGFTVAVTSINVLVAMPRSLSALAVIVGSAIALTAAPRQPEPSHVKERVKSINPVELVASTMPPGNSDSGANSLGFNTEISTLGSR